MDADLLGPAPPPSLGGARFPPTRRDLIVLAGFTVVVAAVVVFGWYAGEQDRPPRRALPPAAHATVLLVPIGSFPLDRLKDLPHDYAAAYGLSMTVAEPMALPGAAFDPNRRQYVAQDLIAVMRAAHPLVGDQDAITIGVTSADVYIRDVPWRWAFAQRLEGTSAVISVARMPNTRLINRWKLFATMMTREIGFLCFELPPSDNPYDVLYRDVLSVSDLQRLFDQL